MPLPPTAYVRRIDAHLSHDNYPSIAHIRMGNEYESAAFHEWFARDPSQKTATGFW